MTPDPWKNRELSASELIQWLQINAHQVVHLTAVITGKDGAIDVQTSTRHAECPNSYRELSAHAQALSHGALLSTVIRDGKVQP